MNFFKREFYPFFISLLVSFLFFNTSIAQIKNSEWYVANAPFKMPQVKVPTFPGRSFSITDYGAIGDGQTLNTEAFSKTIEACAKAGGGKVIVPVGLWLIGPIEMKSNINLVVERGALVQLTKDHSQYPIIKASSKSSNYVVASPIYDMV